MDLPEPKLWNCPQDGPLFWQWTRALHGRPPTYLCGFATEGAARAYGRTQGWANADLPAGKRSGRNPFGDPWP